MYDLLKKANSFKANELIEELVKMGQLICVINIFDKNCNFIGRKLITKNYLKNFPKYKYRDAFHGTKFENLISVIWYGFKKPGEKAGEKVI